MDKTTVLKTINNLINELDENLEGLDKLDVSKMSDDEMQDKSDDILSVTSILIFHQVTRFILIDDYILEPSPLTFIRYLGHLKKSEMLAQHDDFLQFTPALFMSASIKSAFALKTWLIDKRDRLEKEEFTINEKKCSIERSSDGEYIN
jgi:hypothetical protein